MQAIITRHLPATDKLGARIKATCERGNLTLPWPHELSGDAVHRFAVQELCRRFLAEDVAKYGEASRTGSAWAAPFVTAELGDGSRVHVGLHPVTLEQAGVSLA